MHMYTCTQYVHFTTKIYENPLSDFGEVAMITCSSSILNCGQAFKFRKGHNSLKNIIEKTLRQICTFTQYVLYRYILSGYRGDAMTLITFNITHIMLNSAKFIYTCLIVEFTCISEIRIFSVDPPFYKC